VNRKNVIQILGKCALLLAFAGFIFISGCTKRPSQEELTALDEACAAARAAEQKLEELKSERSMLESELEGKKSELRDLEEQRDAIKAQLEEKVNEEAPTE
jgi:septal ring factor EnvC (AmiA/AmiB activator)